MSNKQQNNQHLQIGHHLIINANDEFKEHHGQQHQDNNNHRQSDTDYSLRPAPIATTKQQQMTDIIQTKDAEFDKIFPILHNDAIALQQHKQRLKEECVNFDCNDYKFCPCVGRLIIILCSYQSYICSLYWMKQPVSHFVTYKIYEYEAILADFQHIQRFHTDSNSAQNNVFPYVENMILRKCGIGRVCGNDQCPAFQRHHRDKSKTVENLLLYYKSNTDECSTEKELELELDRIHVYFLHGVLKYANPICSDDVLSADEYKDAFNVHSDGEVLQLQNEWELRLKSYAIMTRIRSKHIATYNVANIENDKIAEDDINTFRGKDRLTMQCIVRDSKTCNELYIKLEKKMGQFVWQRIKSVEGVKNLYNVTARYDNIKDEVLHCPFKIITIYDWNDTLRKSKKIKRSWIGQSIRTHNEEKHGYASDLEQIRHAKWEKNETISLKEIIAIKLYTDFDKLQHALKKCFRIITNYVYQYDDDTLLAMRRRLSSYSNWRQCLTVTIKKFSVSIGYKRFYHGVNPLMIIQRHNILSRLWGPLSATASYHVASTFATDKGMIIEMNSQYPQLPLCYAFDASQLSDYPEESERLVGFMYVRVRKIFSKTPIIMPDSDIAVFEKQNAHLIRLYFFAMRLFLEGIYSMDRFLEKVYVELLTLAIEYREDEMENDLNKVENALKSTKENRKYGIKCKEMFLLKMSEIMLKPSHHFHVILDDISPGLRSLMLRNDKEKDIMSGGDIWNVDFFKIDRIYPNMKGLSLFNKYRFNNYNIQRFLVWLNETRNKEFMLLKFVYFDYYSSSSENQINKRKQSKNKRTEKMFVKLKDLDWKLKEQLKMKGWELKDKELDGYGYRINLRKTYCQKMINVVFATNW